MADFNAAIGVPTVVPSGGSSQRSNTPRLASLPQGGGKPTELVVPTDKAVAQAMEDGLPLVKKVISTHQCAIDAQSLRSLNSSGVPGSNFQQLYFWAPDALVGGYWKYHEKGICPSVQVIDQWKMPALNALAFRVVYFADDSGESDVFSYYLRKSAAGNWQLERFHRNN